MEPIVKRIEANARLAKGSMLIVFGWICWTVAGFAFAAPAPAPAHEADAILRDFRFASGESLPELRIHYRALGAPQRDPAGHVRNAVLILHGTGGAGTQFLTPQFAGVLYGPGALLDTTRYWVILPDGIGHGRSSKPSDGLHARFPHYDYDDMVEAQYHLVTETLGVDHLRLVMGTSMGGMHTWVWGERHPDAMDALMPLACLPVRIAGRNRLWRRMIVDAIKNDPAWKGGDYTAEPEAALRTSADLLILAGCAPLRMQHDMAAPDSADRYLDAALHTRLPALDANDLMYQIEASRNYDPSPDLAKIRAPLVHVNFGDDFINPPELGIAEREIKKVHGGRLVLVPGTPETRGHGTHTWAAVWQGELAALLRASEPGAGDPR